MNNKTLIALLGIGMIPSLLFGQFYRMDIDAQQAGQARVIDRVFTGNTVGLDVGFYDGSTPIPMTNWTVMFQYYDGQYSTNPPIQIQGVSSGNRVVFDSTSNVFYSASENYYFSIAGVDHTGRKRTFARGRMIEEYDPGTAGSVGVSSNGLYFVSWANIFGDPGSNSNLVEYVSMHGGGFGEDAVARAGVASNAADIATLQTGKLSVAAAADTYQPKGNYATGTPLYVESYIGTITGGTITGGTVTTNDGVLAFAVTGGGGGIDAATATNIAQAVAANYLPLAGGTMVGPLMMKSGDSYGISTPIKIETHYSAGAVFITTNYFYAYQKTATNRPYLKFGPKLAENPTQAETNLYTILFSGVPDKIHALELTLGGETRTNWPGTGSGATFTVTGGTNVTVATNGSEYVVSASGGGGEGTNVYIGGSVESDPSVIPWSTNITLIGGASNWVQRIESIDGPTTINLPAKSSTNVASTIWLTVPAVGTNTPTTFQTNSPPIVGFVPTASTNAVSEFLFTSPASEGEWRVRRLR